ncbi:MAG: serine protease [Candidatus Obscuribacterales bacterium]
MTAEKIVGVNNLYRIAWLKRALELARPVARIRTPEGYGTGWLIAQDLLITNNHVLNSEAVAAASIAEFNFETDWNDRPLPVQRHQIDSSVFRTNKDLDYTIVRVKDTPGAFFGFVDLSFVKFPEVNDYVSIIQHPEGRAKEIALTDNKVSDVFGSLLQYTTDTQPGSSGSPVFDQNWNIVGLHHKGGNLIGADGREHFINEAVLMTSIIRDAREFLGLPDPLYNAIFGELRHEMTGFIETDQSDDGVKRAAMRLTQEYPSFGIALRSFADERRDQSSKEIWFIPVLVAAAGVASGAAIRHWARKSGHESIESVGKPLFKIPESISKYVSGYRTTDAMPNTVYYDVLAEMEKDKDALKPLADIATKGNTPEFAFAIPILAQVFLAGVGVGAAAYGK